MSLIKHQVVIVGGGTAGITIAARLARSHRKLDIAVIDPSETHSYQPLWTLVGGGVFSLEETAREEIDCIPPGVSWVKEKVSTFEPVENQVTLESGKKIEYEYLIVAPGIQLDWKKIKGLKETLGKNGVSSNYSSEYVQATWENLKNLKPGDTALFTQPPLPIKCAAPQKAVYLSEDYLRKKGIRNEINLNFFMAGPRIFGVEKYRVALEKVLERKKLHPHYEHNLVEVRGDEKIAIFQRPSGELVEQKYDMLHVVPPQSSPDFIKKSPLADADGWVDVDKYTLQHTQYKNIFSAGDASSLPTSKTGAAVRKQAPVLVANLLAQKEGRPLSAKYDGYTSCPLVTGYGSLILAEFDYDGNPAETFPFNQAKERRSMYLLKAYALPILYWHGMLKGRA